MVLKPFKINIIGKYCDVPHPDRCMSVDISEEEDNIEYQLSAVDILVVFNEILSSIKRKIQLVMVQEDFDNHMKKCQDYYFGEVKDTDKTNDMKIKIVGTYCSEYNPKRKLQYQLIGINQYQATIVLYDAVCIIRNTLSKSMSRDELSEIAEKYNICDFGMKKSEHPFEIR